MKKVDKKPVIIKVDKKLDKYLSKGLFKEKVDKANHILKTVGIPKFAKTFMIPNTCPASSLLLF
jgi:hypothetical protein